MLRNMLPYLRSSARAAVLIQGQCWGHLGPIPSGVRLWPFMPPNPLPGTRLLHPGSSYSREIQRVLGKTGPVPVMGDYLYLLRTAPPPQARMLAPSAAFPAIPELQFWLHVGTATPASSWKSV